MARDDLEPAPLHALYGFSAVVAVGILYSYRTSHVHAGQGVPALRARLPVHHGPRPSRAGAGVTGAATIGEWTVIGPTGPSASTATER